MIFLFGRLKIEKVQIQTEALRKISVIGNRGSLESIKGGRDYNTPAW